MKERLPPQMFAGERPERGRVNPPSNDGLHRWKPAGGIWTSTYDDGTSDWERWCRSEGFALNRLAERWLLQPVDAKVFTIASGDDYERLMASYGVAPYDFDLSSSRLVDMQTVDWERFAGDWDALRLLSPWIDVDGMPLRLASIMFYGWDCESTWWARWRFADVQPI